MRRHALALVALPLFAGCLAAPEPEDFLAVGFRRPEQTFRTFQTALRADLPDLEYRCLSAAFKARQEPRITQIGWRELSCSESRTTGLGSIASQMQSFYPPR